MVADSAQKGIYGGCSLAFIYNIRQIHRLIDCLFGDEPCYRGKTPLKCIWTLPFIHNEGSGFLFLYQSIFSIVQYTPVQWYVQPFFLVWRRAVLQRQTPRHAQGCLNTLTLLSIKFMRRITACSINTIGIACFRGRQYKCGKVKLTHSDPLADCLSEGEREFLSSSDPP